MKSKRKKIKSPTRQGWDAIFGGILFFALGGLGFWVAVIHPLNLHHKQKDYIKRSCRIIESEIVSDIPRKDDGPNSGQWDVEGTGVSYRTNNHHVEVTYEYKYKDRTYRSSRIGFEQQNRREYPKAEKLRQEKYMPGMWRICYIDPKNPEDAVLDRSLATNSIQAGMMFLFFVAIGLLFLGWGVHRVYVCWVLDIANHPDFNRKGRSPDIPGLYDFITRRPKKMATFMIGGFMLFFIYALITMVINEFEVEASNPYLIPGLFLAVFAAFFAYAFYRSRKPQNRRKR